MNTTTSMLTTSLTWFATMFVFLMNVQLGQLFYRRDMVDHAVAVASDVATKTYCQKNESARLTEAEAQSAIAALEDNAGLSGCQLRVRGNATSEGEVPLETSLSCELACKIPIASQVMCRGGKVKFEAKLKTTALGCDGQGS